MLLHIVSKIEVGVVIETVAVLVFRFIMGGIAIVGGISEQQITINVKVMLFF